MKGLKYFMLLLAASPLAGASQSQGLIDLGNSRLRGRGLDTPAICDGKDMFLVLDDSGSQAQEWAQSQQAAGAIIQEVLPPNTLNRMCVIAFANKARMANALNSQISSDSTQLISAVNNLPYMGGGTYLETALTDIQNQLQYRRPGAPVVVGIITDGVDDDQAGAIALAQQIISTGNVIFMCLGVAGDTGINAQFLQQICDPKYTQSYANFAELENAAAAVYKTFCTAGSTYSPTASPTIAKTKQPSKAPTRARTQQPTIMDSTGSPVTFSPSTATPTNSPTNATIPIGSCDPLWPCLLPLLPLPI